MGFWWDSPNARGEKLDQDGHVWRQPDVLQSAVIWAESTGDIVQNWAGGYPVTIWG
jgi:hypothetical protein